MKWHNSRSEIRRIRNQYAALLTPQTKYAGPMRLPTVCCDVAAGIITPTDRSGIACTCVKKLDEQITDRKQNNLQMKGGVEAHIKKNTEDVCLTLSG